LHVKQASKCRAGTKVRAVMRQCGYTAANAVVKMTDAEAKALADAQSLARAAPQPRRRNVYFHKPTKRWRVSRREGGRTINYGSSARVECATRRGEDLGVLVPVARQARPLWIPSKLG
jgi:hypothetical protein